MKKKLGTPNTKPNLFSDRSKKSRAKLFERLLSGKNLKNKEKMDICNFIESAALKKNAEQGDPIAQYYYGRSFLTADGKVSPQDSEKVVYWITQAAEQGDFDAQLELAMMYYDGEHVSQDYKKAAYWYEKVAEKGGLEAQYHLGVMCLNGIGIPQDYEKAVRCFTSAADKGDAEAMNNLGIMYENGYGVKKNHKKAVDLYTEAAEEGECIQAYFNLGILYYEGRGVPRNLKLAYAWLRLGAAQEDEECIELRDELEEQLSAEHLKEARYLAEKIRNRIEAMRS
jgi:uncharacterized protein